MIGLLWVVLLVIPILWLAGFVISFAGNPIHLHLIVVLVVLPYNLVTRRRAVLVLHPSRGWLATRSQS